MTRIPPSIPRVNRWCIGFWLLVGSGVLLLSTSSAWADGSVVRLHATKEPFELTVFTSPKLVRGQPTQLSFLVQRHRTGAVIMGAIVNLGLRSPSGMAVASQDVFCGLPGNPLVVAPPIGPGQNGIMRAMQGQVANSLYYGAATVLPAVGVWQLQVTVQEGANAVQFDCPLPVDPPPNRLRLLAWMLALPPLAVALFALNQWLRMQGAKSTRMPHRSVPTSPPISYPAG